MLARSLRAAAPEGVDDPSIVLLSDGRRNSAWYEHVRLARMLEIPLVELDDLSVRGGRLMARAGSTRIPVDVVYRRTDEDRLTDERRRAHRRRRGALRAALPRHAHLRERVRRGCRGRQADPRLRRGHGALLPGRGAAAALRFARTTRVYESHRDEILDRIDELVVKPRSGFGGHGVVVGPHAEPDDVRAAARALAERPEDFVAQELVMLSTHPTAVDGRLEPRHVDLRPFAFVGDDVEVAPGGHHPRGARPGRARRQQLPARRRQGHLGDGVTKIAADRCLDLRSPAPGRPPARPAGRAAAQRARAGRAVSRGDADGRRAARHPRARSHQRGRRAARPARRALPLRRPRPGPRPLRRAGASRARSDGTRARPLRARPGAARDGPQDPGPRHLSRHAGDERLARRHAPPAPSRPGARGRAPPGDAGRDGHTRSRAACAAAGSPR